MTRTDTPSTAFCTFLRKVDNSLHDRHNRDEDAAELTISYIDLVALSYAEGKTADQTSDAIIADVQS